MESSNEPSIEQQSIPAKRIRNREAWLNRVHGEAARVGGYRGVNWGALAAAMARSTRRPHNRAIPEGSKVRAAR
jgi:hypothetical protein